MFVTVDWVARRYGVLPSELIRSGSSIDIMIADIGQNWENWQQEKAEAKSRGLPPPAPKMTEAEMQAMVDNVKKMKKNDNG